MKNYEIELILQPTGRYVGRRYIKIEMRAENKEEAGNFAVETISVIVTPDVKVMVRSVKEL